MTVPARTRVREREMGRDDSDGVRARACSRERE